MDETREDILGGEGESDFFTLMRAWRFAQGRNFDMQKCRPLGIHAGGAREVGGHARAAAAAVANARGSTSARSRRSPEAIQRCILAGFSDQLARRVDQGTLRCRLVHQPHGRTGARQRRCARARSSSRAKSARSSRATSCACCSARRRRWRRRGCAMRFPDDFSEGDADAFRSEPAPGGDAPDAALPRSRARFHGAGLHRCRGGGAAADGGSALRPLPAEELGRRGRAMVRAAGLPARVDAGTRVARRR